MEIKVVEIKEEEIKKVTKACRKWRFRKQAPTFYDIWEITKIEWNHLNEVIDWMFKTGKIMIIKDQYAIATRYRA